MAMLHDANKTRAGSVCGQGYTNDVIIQDGERRCRNCFEYTCLGLKDA